MNSEIQFTFFCSRQNNVMSIQKAATLIKSTCTIICIIIILAENGFCIIYMKYVEMSGQSVGHIVECLFSLDRHRDIWQSCVIFKPIKV